MSDGEQSGLNVAGCISNSLKSGDRERMEDKEQVSGRDTENNTVSQVFISWEPARKILIGDCIAEETHSFVSQKMVASFQHQLSNKSWLGYKGQLE